MADPIIGPALISSQKATLDTERLFVPWGFAFSGSTDHLPGMPSVSLADMKGFWLSLFNISIAYGGSCSLPHHRKASSADFLRCMRTCLFAPKRHLRKGVWTA